MKALVLSEPKSPLTYRDEPEPELGEGQVRVHLRAAALNRRDYWITQGLYPGVKAPCILGSDGAGMMDDGREVILCPSMDWGDNEAAQGPDYRILGMPDNGTFAEQVAVSHELVFDKPPHLSWAEAAALPLGGVTAFRALFIQGELHRGQTVLVTGIGGGVATFALQFAHAIGAKVLVTSSSEEKLSRAKELGATAGANYRKEGWARMLASEHGPIDLVIDSAGGKGYNDLMGVVKPGGRIVNYGATKGPPPQLDMFKLFWNQVHLVGSTMGSRYDFSAMLELVSSRKIHPVVDQTVPLAEGSDLVASMSGMAQFGKLTLEVSQDAT